MIGSVLVLIYALFCFLRNKVWVICSLIILFPAHQTLRQLIVTFEGQPGLFPLWYDIGIISLFIKQRFLVKYSSSKPFLFLFFLLISFYFLISLQNTPRDPDAFPSYRIYLHCILLFLVFSSLELERKEWVSILKCFVFSAFFYCLSAVFIYFFLQFEWHMLLEHYEVTPSGFEFVSPSFEMMGIERMFGLLPGPNQFGVYMAIVILILHWCINQENLNSKYVIFALVLSYICIFISFSRAGWGIVFGTLVGSSIMSGGGRNIIRIIIGAVITFACCVILLSIIAPDYLELVFSTFDGSDPSASTRQENVMYGLSEISEKPLGHGLGSGTTDYGTPVAESSFVICLFEIGVFSTILLYLFFIITSFKILRLNCSYSKIVFCFINMSLVASLVSMNIFQYPFIYYIWALVGLSVNNFLFDNQVSSDMPSLDEDF